MFLIVLDMNNKLNKTTSESLLYNIEGRNDYNTSLQK